MPLATPTLTVVDNEDATGVVATIAGGDAGATNTLYRQNVSGELGSGTWTSSGFRTGSGTISVSLPTRGFYWWYVLSALAGESVVTNLAYEPVTDGEDAVITRAIAAIVSRLQLLNLTDIESNVVARPLSDDLSLPTCPCCVVCEEPTPPQYVGGTNARDDIGYPIQVLFMTSDGLGANSPVDKYRLWRQQAERAFRSQRLPGLAESGLACSIEPLKTLDPSRPLAYEKMVSGFTIRVFTREVRGLGA